MRESITPRGIPVALRGSVVAVTSLFAAAAFEMEQAPLAARHKERDAMNLLIARFRALLRDSSGQDLLEYALLVALIALVCVAVITSTGTQVQTIFQRISDALTTANTP
jgi:pilus assembly protein Flp/PilA